MRRCDNCKKFFILKSKHKTAYCDRIFKNGKTCKQLGAKLKHSAKVANDEYLKQYDAIYKMMHSRLTRGMDKDFDKDKTDKDLTPKQFLDWSTNASQLREKYIRGEIKGEDMVKGIGG